MIAYRDGELFAPPSATRVELIDYVLHGMEKDLVNGRWLRAVTHFKKKGKDKTVGNTGHFILWEDKIGSLTMDKTICNQVLKEAKANHIDTIIAYGRSVTYIGDKIVFLKLNDRHV